MIRSSSHQYDRRGKINLTELQRRSNGLEFRYPHVDYRIYQSAYPKRIGSRSPNDAEGKTLGASRGKIGAETAAVAASKTELLPATTPVRPNNVKQLDHHSRPPSIHTASRAPSLRNVSRCESMHSTYSMHSHHTNLSTRSSSTRRIIKPSLVTLPPELASAIYGKLAQPDLLSAINVCRAVYDDAIPLLFATPCFASTYRFAQFITCISHNEYLAGLVRDMDLSTLAQLPENEAIAGWREWKYRTDPLYTTVYTKSSESPTMTVRSGGSEVQRPSSSISSHPPASPLLQRSSGGLHDVPLGSLLHLVTCCSRIRKLNLNKIQIASDYMVLPAHYVGKRRHKPLLKSTKGTPTFSPTATNGLLFVSDVPKSKTWDERHVREAEFTVFIDELAHCLKGLVELRVRKAVQFNRTHAQIIIDTCGLLRVADFRECGMSRDAPWARKWKLSNTIDDPLLSLANIVFFD